MVGIVSVVAATTSCRLSSGCWDRVDSLRVPFVGRRVLETAGSESRFWGAIVRGVLRRPGSAWCCPRPCSWRWRPRLRFERGHERRHGSSRPLRLQAGVPRARARLSGDDHRPAEIVVSNASSPATEEALETLRTTLAADPRFGEGEIRRLPTAPWPSSPCRFKETLRTRTPSPR